jgi:hypothetical protein
MIVIGVLPHPKFAATMPGAQAMSEGMANRASARKKVVIAPTLRYD